MFKIFLLFTIFLYPYDNKCEELNSTTAKNDFIDSFVLMGRGFSKQLNWNNLGHTAIFTPLLWHSFREDDRYSNYFQSKPQQEVFKIVSDTAIFMNFPFFNFGLYYLGKKNDDSKIIQFAKENFAANYLAALQTMAFSFLEINKRPNSNKQSIWETAFRGKSSFPSGHVLPYFVLTMKTFQYYGPLYALIPLPIAIITAYERLQSGRHYMSDVVGGAWMAFVASEGVRSAADYQHNHPVFKWIYEHQVTFMPAITESRYAVLFSFNY